MWFLIPLGLLALTVCVGAVVVAVADSDSCAWSDAEYERFHKEYCSEISADLENRYGDKNV